MTMKLGVQEEPAIYEVLLERVTPIFRLGDIARTSSGGTPRRDRPELYEGPIP